MPLFNAEPFVRHAVNSVQSQTYSNWELIIVDDCSTDRGLAVVQSISDDDPRIIVLKNSRNIGGAETRNIAIAKAKGAFIAFLDADDLWEKDKLQNQIDFMSENKEVNFCFSSYKTIDEQGKFINNVKTTPKVNLQKMYSHNYIGCLTVIYRVSTHGKFYMPNIRKRQDFALWLIMLEKFDYAYSLDATLASYRIRKESLSTNKIDAIKYYWKVLRGVAKLPFLVSILFTIKYVFISFVKKKFPTLYEIHL